MKTGVVILKQERVATGNPTVIQIAVAVLLLSLLHVVDQVKIRYYVLKINFGIKLFKLIFRVPIILFYRTRQFYDSNYAKFNNHDPNNDSYANHYINNYDLNNAKYANHNINNYDPQQ